MLILNNRDYPFFSLKKILNKEKDSETFLDKLKKQLYDFSTDISAKAIAEIVFTFLNP